MIEISTKRPWAYLGGVPSEYLHFRAVATIARVELNSVMCEDISPVVLAAEPARLLGLLCDALMQLGEFE